MAASLLRQTGRWESPCSFQGKLQLTRSGVGQGDGTGRRNRVSDEVHDDTIIVGGGKVRVINNIEKVGAKLGLEGIRNSGDRNVLGQRSVEADQSGTGKRVTTFVAQ